MTTRSAGATAKGSALTFCALAVVVAAVSGCGGDETETTATSVERDRRVVDAARLRAADSEPGSWLNHARTQDEQRYSPLARINADNVGLLQRRWVLDTGTGRGLEATPLVIDGVLYTTLTWSAVLALDARTGTLLWRYDPDVPREVGRKACCDVVNRGVAVFEGRVFVGALDGRLVALDAKTGELEWEVVTVDQTKNYTITGAPRIVDGKVVIGNGGAEYNVRGYVSAYHPESGDLLWRTYTIPGDPALPFESPALEAAAKTWHGEWWKVGGGGTVWDSMAYDPELGLLYVGTGNGTPWVQEHRSPGGGDNLYLSSILALDPSNGEIVWHYQTTPGETWDFTATQHIILADLELAGRTRKVLMQAPKNGFFYLLDRETGEFLSAEPYVNVTWATHVDASGRPVETERFGGDVQFVQPTFYGGHNWQPMSFNPQTGLVYIPAQEILGAYRVGPRYRTTPHDFNVGTDFNVFAAFPPEAASGHLLAWDPVAQREAWRVPYGQPWNGGTLTTAGNLVFQGTADGRFVAYSADTGRTLFVDHTETGVIAAPMTYEIDGVQYVSIMAGWGGAFGIGGGTAARGVAVGPGKLITYALATSLPDPAEIQAFITRPGAEADGERLYHDWCARCHGAGAVSKSVIPDLRHAVVRLRANLDVIALEGIPGTAMPALANSIDAKDAALIRQYLEIKAKER